MKKASTPVSPMRLVHVEAAKATASAAADLEYLPAASTTAPKAKVSASTADDNTAARSATEFAARRAIAKFLDAILQLVRIQPKSFSPALCAGHRH